METFNKLFRWVVGGIVVVLLAVGYYAGFIFPPMPTQGESITIRRGMNAENIANALKEYNVIRSRTLFVWFAYFSGIENKLAAGKFQFQEPQSLFSILQKLSGPQHETTIVITEGMSASNIKELLARNNIPAATLFLDRIQTYRNNDYPFLASIPKNASVEGFLFPDTYRLYESADADEIIGTLVGNFDMKIKPLEHAIASSGRPLYDTVILASILEREVQTPEDKAIVAGIFLKRMKAGIPLQADATLAYETGKASKDLTAEDLKNNTPFNTYTRKGLPPSPLGNPGIDAIRAAIFPTSSPYMYYLSDNDGRIHYARTFEEHKKNKALYLQN